MVNAYSVLILRVNRQNGNIYKPAQALWIINMLIWCHHRFCSIHSIGTGLSRFLNLDWLLILKFQRTEKLGGIFFYLYIFMKLSVLYQVNDMHLICALLGIEFCVILYCLQSSKKKPHTWLKKQTNQEQSNKWRSQKCS